MKSELVSRYVMPENSAPHRGIGKVGSAYLDAPHRPISKLNGGKFAQECLAYILKNSIKYFHSQFFLYIMRAKIL